MGEREIGEGVRIGNRQWKEIRKEKERMAWGGVGMECHYLGLKLKLWGRPIKEDKMCKMQPEVRRAHLSQ